MRGCCIGTAVTACAQKFSCLTKHLVQFAFLWWCSQTGHNLPICAPLPCTFNISNSPFKSHVQAVAPQGEASSLCTRHCWSEHAVRRSLIWEFVLQDARAGSSSPPEAEQQQSADAELQHPFDEDDADLSPPAAHSEQPPPAGDRIQPSEHPFEPGGVLRHRGGSSDDGPGFNGGVNTSCASAPDAQRERGRVSFEESSCRQHHRASFSAGSSPPSPYLRQHHGQPLGSVPALRAPSGATALSVDAAAAMAVASGRVSPGAAAEAVEAAEAASRQPGGSPRHGAGRARSRDETMGVGHGANGAGSDGGSAMSVDALDSHAFDGHAADGSQHHLSEPGMVHSSSAKTLKVSSSAIRYLHPVEGRCWETAAIQSCDVQQGCLEEMPVRRHECTFLRA